MERSVITQVDKVAESISSDRTIQPFWNNHVTSSDHVTYYVPLDPPEVWLPGPVVQDKSHDRL